MVAPLATVNNFCIKLMQTCATNKNDSTKFLYEALCQVVACDQAAHLCEVACMAF